MNEREAISILREGGYVLGLDFVVIHKLTKEETEKESLALNFLITELNYKTMSMKDYYETKNYL